jgi:uncharacterized membrane protein YbhN (UPF0104 family)
MDTVTSPTVVERPQALGLLLFASRADDPRARRPTDILITIGSALLLLVSSVLATLAADLESAFADLLAQFPSFLDPFWKVLAWAPLGWALVLIGAALLRHRAALARDMIGGVVIAGIVSVFAAAVVTDDAWAAVSRLLDLDGPPAFPPGVVTLSVAILAVASPHVTRPFRHFGRWLIAGQVIGALFLGVTRLTGALVAVAVGLLGAAIVHLLVGSPGGRPTADRIKLALFDLGIDVVHLEPSTMRAGGVLRFTGADSVGPIDVKVYGRDAWDAQLMANAWRLAWYRGSQRTTRLSRLELVEHEGFMTLLAERAGVRVPKLLTAGRAGQGDALVVVRRDGRPLVDGSAVSEDVLLQLWDNVGLLHKAGLALGRVEADGLQLRDDGSVGFTELSAAFVAESIADRRRDQAQVLALGLVLADEETTVAAARSALGDERLLKVLPYVQEAALPRTVLGELDEKDIDLDKFRNRLRTTLGAEEQELIKLRRVTGKSLLNLLLLGIAAYALITAFGDIDLAAFADALRDASWWWLAFALILGQIPRVPAAISTRGSLEGNLPLGPLTVLQFAICYVNLAIPSTAARVLINVRFFQRFGVTPTTAMTAGVIDSVAGFIVQILLFLGLFLLETDLHFDISSDTSELSGLGTIVLIAIIAVVVGVIVVLVVPSLRRRVIAILRKAAQAMRVLKSPMKLLELFGGNLLSQVLFGVAMAACVLAFHEELPLGELILINTVVSLFAGLLPVPGGIGVAEAGLTLGLTTAGLSSEKAFAVAIAYRFVTFYLPPIWGYFCYRWLVKRRYL